ncbi:MAG TPA: archaemetzincin [Bacteroidia bacterium]
MTIACKDKTQNNQEERGKNTPLNVDTTGYSLNAIKSLHQRLTVKYQDKSLADYILSNPNKVDSTHYTVYLLPFGNMKPEVENIIKEEVRYLEAFLQLKVKVLPNIPYDSIKNIASVETRMVPQDDYNYFTGKKGEIKQLREQINARSFIDKVLKSRKPADAVAILGITEHDIYQPKYNYLFGLSELKSGLGVVSTFRMIDYGEHTKYNIRKVVSKQIVNMFSIDNVKDYRCVLNYHNDDEELAKGSFDLSPAALEKLKYATGLKYEKRFSELLFFWLLERNKEETKYYKKCLELLKYKPIQSFTN